MNKRGMTLSALAAIILLIIAFGILTYFIINLGFDTRADSEACKQSVVMRGTVSNIPGLDAFKSYIPLKCKEKKICIASNPFGSCDEFAGEKGVVIATAKDKTAIEKIVAQEILECWTTMGEGKLDLFSEFLATRTGLGKIHASCVICSRIAIDENIKSVIDLEEIKKIDVERYMATRAVPGKSVSYYTYMLGSDVSLGQVEQARVKIADLDFVKKIGPDIFKELEATEELEDLNKEDLEIKEINLTEFSDEIDLEKIKDKLYFEYDENSKGISNIFYFFNGKNWYYSKLGEDEYTLCGEKALSGPVRGLLRRWIITEDNKEIIKNLEGRDFEGGLDVLRKVFIHSENNKRIKLNIYFKEGLSKTLIKSYSYGEISEEISSTLIIDDSKSGLKEYILSEYEWQGQEVAVLFMQVSSPEQGKSLANIGKAGVALAAGSFLVSGGAGVAGTAAQAGISAVQAAGLAGDAAVTGATTSTPLLLNPWTWVTIGLGIGAHQGWVGYNRALAAGYCGDVSSGTNARNGCSVVRVVKYEPELINKYCTGNIESTP